MVAHDRIAVQGSVCGGAGTSGPGAEIGTGCGYQAAVLAMLARSVVSVERVQGLHERARANLGRVRLPVTPKLIWADGRLGAARLTASSPPPVVKTCRPPGCSNWLGGRLVAPMSKAAARCWWWWTMWSSVA